ncbi:hypothetical protein H4582DRAFT_1920651 [Lactarius indigo]|nr:hypothetical protein H4582DRAFT_1920651 [Lactarius indigo]
MCPTGSRPRRPSAPRGRHLLTRSPRTLPQQPADTPRRDGFQLCRAQGQGRSARQGGRRCAFGSTKTMTSSYGMSAPRERDLWSRCGDILCDAYLARQVNPSLAQEVLQNFIYVENASLAHFCYERRLIETARGSPNSNLGGQTFCIVDDGPPTTYGDVYTVLATLTDGRTALRGCRSRGR